MTQLFPGDKVSFINDKLSGTVKRIIDKKQVLLLLDDGFEFPANISELVVTERIAAKEQEKIIEDLSIIADEEDKSDKLFFGTVSEDTGKGILVKAYLVNTTKSLVHFVLYNASFGDIKGLTHGVLEPSRALKVLEFDLSQYEHYRHLALLGVRFAEKAELVPEPVNISFRLKQVSLIKEQKLIPVLKLPGYLINLTDYLQNHQQESRTFREPMPSNIKKPDPVPEIIDLHLEELTEHPKDMMPHAALELQLKVFQNNLEKALTQDMKQVTFIHGIGQGRLKQEIRKKLGENPFVQGFDDADHKKFGYGATIVFLKSR